MGRLEILFGQRPDLTAPTTAALRAGAIIQHTEYLPFGEPLIEQSSASADWQTSWLFNSKEYDPETGLSYYGARYYDPALALWLSPDPLSEIIPNCSPYIFVRANPVNRIDPIGLTDYDVNGEINNIPDGHDNLRISVESSDFHLVQKAFHQGIWAYEALMNKLSVKNGFTLYEYFSDSEATSGLGYAIIRHRAGEKSYSEFSLENMSSVYNNIDLTQGYICSGIGSIWDQADNIALGSNNRIYLRNGNTKGIFNGNQYVSVKRLSKICKTKYIKRGTYGLGIICCGIEAYQGYQQDGEQLGYNTALQASKAACGFGGSIVGGCYGVKWGGLIGAHFGGVGAVPGAIIGGFIGSVVGAWGGEWIGGESAKAVMEQINQVQ